MTLTTGETVTLNIDGSIVFKDGLTKAEWYEVHRRLCHTKKYATAWIKASREYGIIHHGMDYVADAEVQIEFDLGMMHQQKLGTLNPADKSKAIVTIEGIHQSFVLWQRKMSDEVEEWDKDKLTRALDLLEPMERQAKRVRELLGR